MFLLVIFMKYIYDLIFRNLILSINGGGRVPLIIGMNPPASSSKKLNLFSHFLFNKIISPFEYRRDKRMCKLSDSLFDFYYVIMSSSY